MKDQALYGKETSNAPPISTTPALSLIGQSISISIDKDNNTPVLNEMLSRYAIDNYNFEPERSLGAFSRFEKSNIYNIPDRIFQEYRSLDCITNMGMFPELQKAWLTIDDKLIIWNYQASAHEEDFYTIDAFKNTILTVQLVKPKPKVFVDSVNYLLLVSTSMDIHILAVQHSANKLEIADTKMSVPTQGLIVNKFITFDYTNEIFFTGIGNGENIWKLSYSNSDEWFQRNCFKECLTKSGLSSVVPTYNILQKIPGLNILANDPTNSPKSEVIVQLQIDQERRILYTLSSKSTIRAYRLKIVEGKAVLGNELIKRPYNILKDLATTTINFQSPLLRKDALKIVNIFTVKKNESDNLFLVAVTDTGCRLYINGSTIYDRLTLTTSDVKFPPPDEKFYEKVESLRKQKLQEEQDFLNSGDIQPRSKSVQKQPVNTGITPQDLKQAQESSTLLKDLKTSLIVSPGIFVCYNQDKLYTSVPDYGVLKNSFQYIEDFELADKFDSIRSIVQLTPSFHATDKPKGYSNEFATQYSKSPLEIAVLTNTGIHVYRYRTPDLILEDSLDEATFNKFSDKYGTKEACSTALYLACKYGQSDSFKQLATKFFISGGKNSKLNKNLQPIVDNVELSDRFYALILLISRLVRDFWDKEVFKLEPTVKLMKNGFIANESLKTLANPKVLLSSPSITKQDLEYFLCSLLIIINFFEKNEKIIPGLSGPNYQFDSSVKTKESEICFQAEHIGFTAILKFLNSMKEGLSFLATLYDDDETTNKGFQDVMSYLTLQSQADLSYLTFSEFFTSDDPYVSKLIKEILSSVINRSIVSGNSVELVASTLQEKCGSFCSTGDVLIFKAIESLKKAKEFDNSNDSDMKNKHLKAATQLLEKTSESLSFETITDAVNVMLQLEYYSGAISFLLNVAKSLDQTQLAMQYIMDGQASLLAEDPKKKAYEQRSQLYQLVFQILVDIDEKAILSLEQASNNSNIITHYSQLRDLSYEVCFQYQDKVFHYEFYKWFIKNGVGEKLLDIETPYVLEFLKDYSPKDFEMAKLLWVYYSRRENYYEAAKVLLELATSDFDLDLANRIQYLSRANSFCNCVCPPNLRQEMALLAPQIIDLMAVSNLQDELLLTIVNDSRITELAKQKAVGELNNTILSMSDLFNDFIDPLGYYELSLIAFKVSDHRNSEDILMKWESLLDSWYFMHQKKQDSSNEPFYSDLTNRFILIASRLSSTESLFPIIEIFQLLAKYIYSDEFSDNSSQRPSSSGLIIDTLIRSGVSYAKLYYNLRELIESATYEVFKDYTKVLNSEMCYLIKFWYKNDKRLRDVIGNDEIRDLNNYSTDSDPIFNYIKATGNPL
ncbi:hypothetical protein CANARDRAFT_231688 [[Candida] arabinofermentans NRRL YB-2248]|uniref:Nucleoporin Nup133/Nup155-like N-terminal domain-containing protein n=1 Tax=[Candida] arabinofermentans NRRL YB-2248 TaxID=983967 RepID=A0A1E4T3C0_9ASCO|nr:hypothetical protein CANARDRAFT_231688 [[Candida] arabinofermentans NRRL YB-2248]